MGDIYKDVEECPVCHNEFLFLEDGKIEDFCPYCHPEKDLSWETDLIVDEYEDIEIFYGKIKNLYY